MAVPLVAAALAAVLLGTVPLAVAALVAVEQAAGRTEMGTMGADRARAATTAAAAAAEMDETWIQMTSTA